MNTLFGIFKFIHGNTFSNSVNGYLFNDTCVFAVELFVVKNAFKEGCLSMVHNPAIHYHTWNVTNFSSLVDERYVSESFGCYKWNISLYPNGNGEGRDNRDYLFDPSNNIAWGWYKFLSFVELKNSNKVYLVNDTLIIEAEVTLLGRNALPIHYLFKIEYFSLLSKSSIVEFCSDVFEAVGYKWKLWIYPTGDNSITGNDHVSINLELLETSSLPSGWEVNVIANFFIYNHLQNKYFSNQDVKEMHYHSMRTIFGISKFIDLNTFSSRLNGYLFNDNCVFGVEVFVVKNSFKEGRLTMMHDPATYYHTWKVTDFSSLVNERYQSESFGCYKWNIWLYPSSESEGKGNSISLFLGVSWSSITPNTNNIFVKLLLRVKDQMNGKHIEKTGENLFNSSDKYSSGWSNFLSLAKLKDPKQGYLVDDTLIIEAEVTLLGLVLTKCLRLEHRSPFGLFDFMETRLNSGLVGSTTSVTHRTQLQRQHFEIFFQLPIESRGSSPIFIG
ncbi:hypothetical protein Q3G72_022595 [Acer saccharum]|nr:hypothetical protein Q3G72_022595 [Acer saccharum]